MSPSPPAARLRTKTKNMQVTKNLLQKYNTADSLFVISSYPKKHETYSQGVCAEASFTKKTLLALQKQYPEKKIIVLTMKTPQEQIYEENNMLIIRCFERNNPLSYLKLFDYIKNFRQVTTVLIEFEFASFGNTITTGLLSPFVWSLRLMEKQVTIVIHQVVNDLKKLDGHIGISGKSIHLSLLNLSLKLFYQSLCLASSHIAVREEIFVPRLQKLIGKKPITVIPLGVDSQIVKKMDKSLRRAQARKLLGIDTKRHIVMYFGYITWYKGVDILMKALKDKKHVHLVIAGGPSFTQQNKLHYQKFLKKVTVLGKNAKNITITGFIPEEKIPLYFQAADLVVFPYRTCMSASGPLTLALAFGKPFLLSKKLESILHEKNLKTYFESLGIEKQQVVFDLRQKDIVRKIHTALDKKTYKKLEQISHFLSTQRTFEKIAEEYGAVLFSQKSSRSFQTLRVLRFFHQLLSSSLFKRISVIKANSL